MSEEVYHIPALLPEALEALNIRPGGVYVDATFGGGGHSRAIADRLDTGRLIAFDQDSDAVERAFTHPRLTLVQGNFRYLRNYLLYNGVEQIDGLLADLGVSFHHFDDADRGFSFRFDGPLDMRMNRAAPLTAADLLNDLSGERLAEIFRLYGELRNGRRIADAIVKARAKAPFARVEQLLDVVNPLVDPRQQKKELACIFQALRIEVNDEIGALRALLGQALRMLVTGGRLAIITYHSLEDRLVKNFMRTGNLEGREEKDFFGHNLSPLRLLTTKPIVASATEVEANPRSRSAKLRVAEKLPPTPNH